MQIDIAAHIEKLLFLHDTLNVPGFGGFSATKAPAKVDYAGGAVAPPSKTLTFSENLSIDDGILVDDLVKTHQISLDEARAAIQAFVEQLQQQLNQREIVTLHGVGRLYKNYVQKIQFLPDATNFHAGSYGLPPLQFSPIARSRELAETPPPAETSLPPVPTPPAPMPAPAAVKPADTPSGIPPLPPPPNFVHEPYTAPRSSAARFGTGVGIGLIVCTIAFGIWWWQNRTSQHKSPLTETELEANADEQPATAVPGLSEIAKLAQKDQKEARPATPSEREDQDLNDEVEEAAAKKVEILSRQNEAPPGTVPPSFEDDDRRLCVLIIATLQDRNNADRLIAKLKGAGYDVYYRQVRGHQVGIQFKYRDPQTIQQKKAELVEFTGEKSIFVKQK
ncbi:MAG: hypothetical protein JNK89_05750 [Saprospiraceae bacterium]|nr:hypothetical protein [Saprospiraceae bacterium]